MKKKTEHLIKAADYGMALVMAAIDGLNKENCRFDPVLPRDYAGDDEAIEELRGLSKNAQGFLQHHINTVLCAVFGYIEMGTPSRAQHVVWQLVDIMKKINPHAEVRDDAARIKAEDTAAVRETAAAQNGG